MDEADARRASRFDALNAFVDHGQAQLAKAGCGAAVRLWFTLWRHESAATGQVRIGQGRLAEALGTSRKGVQRMLAQLEEHGFLKVLDRGRPGRGSVAAYALLVPVERASLRRLFDDPDKGVAVTPLGTEKASTGRLSDDPEKGVTVTPFVTEKASPAPRKGVTVTQVQKVQKKTKIAARAARGSKADRGTAPVSESRSRVRDELFDALVEVTGSDPNLNGSHVGKVRKALLGASYGVAEVREFAARWRELLPWAKPVQHPWLTLGILEKHISVLRMSAAQSEVEPTILPFRAAADAVADALHDPFEESAHA